MLGACPPLIRSSEPWFCTPGSKRKALHDAGLPAIGLGNRGGRGIGAGGSWDGLHAPCVS
jgi:hypothetical protein